MLTREGALTSIPDNRQHLFVGRGDGVVFAGLLVAICLLPLVKGGNREWLVMWFSVAIFALLALWSMLFAAGRVCFARAIGPALPVISLWLLWLLYLVLQNMSWPVAAVESSAPFLYEHYSLLALVNQSLPDNLPFTVSTGESRLYLVESLGYFFLFVLVLLTVRGTKRRQFLAMTLVFSGLFQALYGSFVVLTGIDYLFFSGQENNPGSATGTFSVRNHFAGYLEMGLALGIGLLVGTLNTGQAARTWREFFVDSIDTLLGPKMRLRIFLAIMVIALVLSRSRMGNAAFFMSLPLCGVLFMILQRKIHKGAIILFVSLILVDVLIVSQWFGLDQVAERIQSTSTETEMRDEVIRDTLTMLPDYQLFGSGAGTYMQTFQRYDDVRAARMVDFAVNDYLEFLVEFGWVGYVPLAILVLYSLFKAANAMAKRRTQLFRGIGFGAMMGTVSILIHSFVDFNLQMPANALLFVLLLALALLSMSLERGGVTRRKRTSHAEAGYSQ